MNLPGPSLIVPIDLQALCVGSADVAAQATVLSPEADFSLLPYSNSGSWVNASSYTSSRVMAGSAPFDGAVPAQYGIHLHWALPDGLTQANPPQDQPDAESVFPQVPNRWLLTRIILDSGNPATPVTTTASWVIESDRLMAVQDASLPPAFPQPTVPLDPVPGGQNYNFIGQAFPLASWAESTAQRLSPLTATGYGSTAFAAYYPNSSTVFGFLDNFEGVTYNAASSTVHYQVAGWYSDPTNDPLNGQQTDPAANPYGWTFTAGTNPQSIVCNGIITGITWNPETAYLSTKTNPLTAALGNDSPEAFAALLANINGNKTAYPNAELLLNLLQFNYLSKLGQIPDALQSFEETLHKASFAPFRSGSRWRILSNNPAKKELHKKIAGFREPLQALNQLQQAADEQLLSLNAESAQLFADWYKYLALAYDKPEGIPANLTVNDAQQFVASAATPLAQAVSAYAATYLTPLQTAEAALSASLPGDLRLVQSEPAAHYWQANNPVLILAGADVVPPARYGNDGSGNDDNLLPCRLDSELLTGLALQPGFVTGSSAAALVMAGLPALAAQPADAPVVLLNQLFQEAFLLTPALQNTVAATLGGQGGAGNPATLDFAGTVQALQAGLVQLMAGQPPANATYTGLVPDPSMIFPYAGTPWLPISMQYSVFYQPVQSVDTAGGSPVPYPPAFINEQFAWDNDTIELQYQGTGLQAGATYTGSVTLTPNARQDLAFSIQHYLGNAPHSADSTELQALLTEVQQLPQLAQGMSGFLDSMAMSQQVLQMPVWDPLANSIMQTNFVKPVAQAVNGQNFVAPQPGLQFNPIRSGGLEITQIRLVDAFGQYKDYLNPTVFVGQTLLPPPALTASGVQAFLPPRITQPARLDISWLPADGEDSHSPLIGWVLPNRLDNSVFIYDASGDAIGELMQPPGTNEVIFMPAAGSSNPPGTTFANALTGLNSQLASVMTALYNNGDSSYLSPFLAAVNQALGMILPPKTSDDQASALLIGQPLVLANIAMQLDLLGRPVTDQSWYGFAEAINGGTRTDGGLSTVQFPVQLGDLLQLNDGLVGFWPGNGQTSDLSTFYSPGAQETSGPVVAPVQDTIVITPSPAADPLNFLLLLDPQAPVHATTGILPVKTFSLAQETYSGALAKLKVTFLTAPILSGANDGSVALPIPDETQGTWNWISVQSGAWNPMALEQQTSQQATLNYTPQRILDGWLQLSNFEPEKP
ncbi:hypothetical protein C7T94_04100 [Pedobacter yulinensis]|uniref:Uncharacterized protein n=1 Tax=Pedobacter yulinensis TaxID=2126353 RepID=A0A2T3HNG1_9SPHI|nr:hypothetical protein [Pedobacter yulinensis]PST83933.1 hypothetical protein C7T94_04100 [Pedobacter yulinensis]